MVGDQVDDQAHAAGPEGGHQLAQAGLAAQLGGDLGRVDHVVAVVEPLLARRIGEAYRCETLRSDR